MPRRGEGIRPWPRHVWPGLLGVSAWTILAGLAIGTLALLILLEARGPRGASEDG